MLPGKTLTSKIESRVGAGYLVLAALFVIINILDLLTSLAFTADSATYISVAQNLLSVGQFQHLIETTNFQNAPGPVPYLEQPPGFPVFLSPFVGLFDDPSHAAIAAQAVAISLFGLALYAISQRAGISLVSFSVLLILFTFLRPFRLVLHTIWSETIFISSILGVCYFALGSSNLDRILLVTMLSMSTSIRYTGVANAVLVIPILVFDRSPTNRTQWALRKRVGIALSICGASVVFATFIAELFPSADPGIGRTQLLAILIGLAGLVTGAAITVLSWRANVAHCQQGMNHEAGDQSPDRLILALMIIASSLGPLLVWFGRNIVLFGEISRANRPLQVFQVQRLWDPVEYLLSNIFPGPPLIGLLVAVAALVVIFLPLTRGSLSSRSSRWNHLVLVSLMLSHLGLIWLLSLVTAIPSIGHRFIAPVLALMFLVIASGLESISSRLNLPALAKAALISPLILLSRKDSFTPPNLRIWDAGINYPIERELWKSIYTHEWAVSASHFYSDESYAARGNIHQIYAQKPQGILWDRTVLEDPQDIESLLSQGTMPFIVVTEGSRESRLLNRAHDHEHTLLGRIEYPDLGFVLFYLKD